MQKPLLGENMSAKKEQLGFTLIEMMIVVAMIAIISTIAFSSYQSSTVRANRAAAANYVLEVANMQERFLLDNRNYATSMTALGATPPAEVSNHYTVTTGDNNGTSTVPSYFVKADPKAAQNTNDTDCGWLQLDNIGNKTTEIAGTRCWR